MLDAGPYRLRGFVATDAGVVREAGRDPVIPLVTSVPPGATAAQARAFVERQRHRLRDGYGYSFAVAEAATDRAVGAIGLWLRDIDRGRASVGYWVAAPDRGRGGAGRALAALSTWALDELRVPRLELYVEPWNAASIRTAEGAGYRCEGLLRSWEVVGDERRDMYVYSLLPGDRSEQPGDRSGPDPA